MGIPFSLPEKEEEEEEEGEEGGSIRVTGGGGGGRMKMKGALYKAPLLTLSPPPFLPLPPARAA